MTQAVLYTVNGTGIPDPFGPGFPADLGRMMSDPWNDVEAQFWGAQVGNVVRWQPVGYPAATYPMGPSVDAGRAEVNRLISLEPVGTPIILSGWSQGAIVTGEVWAYDILAPGGRHHNRLGDVVGIIQFGDPIRCPGIANGNRVAGLPMPAKLDGNTTGGIAGPKCLTPEQTPDFYLSCALDGDLYAAAPVGDDPWRDEPLVGQIETAIYDFVLTADVGAGLMVIAERIAQMFEMPVTFAIAHVQAITNGLTFAAQGMNAPHWRYEAFMAPMADWIRDRVNTRGMAAA